MMRQTGWSPGARTPSNGVPHGRVEGILGTDITQGPILFGPMNPIITPEFLRQEVWRQYHQTTLHVILFYTMTPFSNFYRHATVKVTIPSWCGPLAGRVIIFQYAEMGIMACKASLFGDEERLQHILQCTYPGEAKAAGRRVINFVDEVWQRHVGRVASFILWAKFATCPVCWQALDNTENHILGEASPTDQLWGIGFDRWHRHARQPTAWSGSNLLGQILMEVRAQIRRDRHLEPAVDMYTHPQAIPVTGRGAEEAEQCPRKRKGRDSPPPPYAPCAAVSQTQVQRRVTPSRQHWSNRTRQCQFQAGTAEGRLYAPDERMFQVCDGYTAGTNEQEQVDAPQVELILDRVPGEREIRSHIASIGQSNRCLTLLVRIYIQSDPDDSRLVVVAAHPSTPMEEVITQITDTQTAAAMAIRVGYFRSSR